MPDLAKRAVADVDAGTIDDLLVAPDDRLDCADPHVAIESLLHRREPIAIEDDVIVDQRNVAGRRLAIRGVDSGGKADVRFASNDADAGQLQRRARTVVEDDHVTRGNDLLFDRIDAVEQHRTAVDIEHDDLDVTHDPSDRGKWCRTNNGTRSAR